MAESDVSLTEKEFVETRFRSGGKTVAPLVRQSVARGFKLQVTHLLGLIAPGLQKCGWIVLFSFDKPFFLCVYGEDGCSFGISRQDYAIVSDTGFARGKSVQG